MLALMPLAATGGRPLRGAGPILFLVLLLQLPAPSPSAGAELTLEAAIEKAVGSTARAGMIRGDLEVAEQNYQARRITFFVPSISINGALPSYSVDQSYRFFGSSARKRIYKTRGLGFNSFIQLRQSLLTGGNLDIRANLNADEDRYPDTDPLALPGTFLRERTRRGYFDFSLSQPLLKPSAPKNELANRRDDLALARLSRSEEELALAQEVVTAYVGALQGALQEEAEGNRQEAATLKAGVDSMKWQDGVISEEAWLASASARLDAELGHREAAGVRAERRRTLALLLDRDPADPVDLVEPVVTAHPGSGELDAMEERWESSYAIQKAERTYEKSARAASYAATGHGLTGDLSAKYTAGRGRVSLDDAPDDNINTNGWGLSLNFSYPIWDGGAAGAEVKAARFQAERARLELQKARQNARAEIARMADQLDVSFRRLEILRKQVELAEERLRIAGTRMEAGRVSRQTYIETRVLVLDAKVKYMKELETYLNTRMRLDQGFAE